MKTNLLLIIAVLTLSGCVNTPGAGTVTPKMQMIADAVEDALSIGLVPVLSRNPDYVPAAQAVAARASRRPR